MAQVCQCASVASEPKQDFRTFSTCATTTAVVVAAAAAALNPHLKVWFEVFRGHTLAHWWGKIRLYGLYFKLVPNGGSWFSLLILSMIQSMTQSDFQTFPVLAKEIPNRNNIVSKYCEQQQLFLACCFFSATIFFVGCWCFREKRSCFWIQWRPPPPTVSSYRIRISWIRQW